MRRKIIITVSGISAITVLMTILVGGLPVSGQRSKLIASEIDNSNKAAAEQPISVMVMRPVRRPLVRNLTIPGTLRADKRADLYAKTSGYITMINVDIGSRVRKGDVLLKIAVPELADELRQCQAVLESKLAKVQALASAQKLQEITTGRKEDLAHEKAISQQELDKALSQLAIAKANTKVAESDVAIAKAVVARLTTLLKYTTIRAPFGGLITARNFDVGAFVRSAAEGQTVPLFALAATDRIRVVMEIPESDASFVRAGTQVEIRVQSLPEGAETITAAITRTSAALNARMRTMRVEVDLDNKNGRLAPGMYAQTVVKLEVKNNALLIPSKSIRVHGRDVAVLVVNNGVTKSIAVEIGYDDGIWTEIVSGLEGNEQIIVSASSAAAPGTPVKSVLVENTRAVAAKE